jgi:hypothetical protein
MGTAVASKNVITPKFRVSYPYIFRPNTPMQQGQEPKFSITMLFDKSADLTALKAEAMRAGKEKWGEDVSKWPKNWRNPFRDQGEKEVEGYEKGAMFITATSKQRPGLVDASVSDIIEERLFYPGCYARASVRAFAYDNKGNKGISFGLQHVQKLGEGQPLGGRTTPQADFEPVAEEGGASEGGDPKNIFG